VKCWYIRLDGFPGHYIEAETKAKARWKDFRAAQEAGYFGRRDFRRYLASLVCVQEAYR
jgi:hypothetical protein